MEIKKVLVEDSVELRKICIDAYSLNFHDHWDEGGLDWYLDLEFSNERILSDLEDEETDYYFIIHELKKVGFIKVSNDCISDLPAELCVELEKMYVLPECKGLGLGKLAMNEIIKMTVERDRKYMFLSVIDSNISAIAFYKSLGFTFHSKTSLDIPYFKEELKGMHRMVNDFG